MTGGRLTCADRRRGDGSDGGALVLKHRISGIERCNTQANGVDRKERAAQPSDHHVHHDDGAEEREEAKQSKTRQAKSVE